MWIFIFRICKTNGSLMIFYMLVNNFIRINAWFSDLANYQIEHRHWLGLQLGLAPPASGSSTPTSRYEEPATRKEANWRRSNRLVPLPRTPPYPRTLSFHNCHNVNKNNNNVKQETMYKNQSRRCSCRDRAIVLSYDPNILKLLKNFKSNRIGKGTKGTDWPCAP